MKGKLVDYCLACHAPRPVDAKFCPECGQALPVTSLATEPGQPIVLVVSKLGRGHYTTISQALAVASAGAIIRVEGGVYSESIIIDKPVEIAGIGRVEDIVIETNGAPCVTMRTEQAVLRNLSLHLRDTGETSIEDGHYGVDIPTGQLTLLDCQVTSNSWSCVGIYGASADPIIRRCTIHRGTQAGVLVKDHGRGLIEDCEIVGNQTGIEVREGGTTTIRRCRMHEHRLWGLFAHTNASPVVEDCDFFDGNIGMAISTFANPAIRRCKVHDQRDDGVRVFEEGRGLLEDCEIIGNGDIGLWVNGENTAATLRRTGVRGGKRGINIDERGHATIDRCDITGNTQSCVVAVDATVDLLHCTLSHEATATFIVSKQSKVTFDACDIKGASVAAVVVYDATATITMKECFVHDGQRDGLYIRGQATLDDCEVSGNNNRGLAVEDKAQLTLNRCRIHNNKASGVSVDKSSQGKFVGCTLCKNGHDENGSYSNIWVSTDSTVALERCHISEAHRYGACFRHGSKGTIEDCDVYGNERGGVWIGESSTPTLHRCRITRNKHYGITVERGCATVVEDCDITNNAKGAWNLPLFGSRVRRARNQE